MAQKLGQLQPLTAVFPQESWANLHQFCGADLTPSSPSSRKAEMREKGLFTTCTILHYLQDFEEHECR